MGTSFLKPRAKGRNGKSVGVDGKTRNRITREEFARVAFECNGDVVKMAEESNLDQPKAAVKQRYENLVKAGFQLENKSLPPMIYTTERTHTTIDNKMLCKLAVEWNKSGGDAEYVADSIGCSVATVLLKIKKLDEQYEKIYFKKLVADYINKEMDEEEAKKQANLDIEEDGFESPLCPRKVGQRGRQGVPIDNSIISSINDLLKDVEVPEIEEEPTMEDIVAGILAEVGEEEEEVENTEE